jgi:hypothetical protein
MRSRPPTSVIISATSTVPRSRWTRLRRRPASSPIRDPQTAVGADQNQGAVAGADGAGQPGDLGRGQKPHLLPLDLGQRYPLAWRLRDHAGVNSGRQHLAQEVVGLADGGWRQLGRGKIGHHSASQSRNSTRPSAGSVQVPRSLLFSTSVKKRWAAQDAWAHPVPAP